MISEADALGFYLGQRATPETEQRLSSFVAALRDARGTTNRDPDTGNKIKDLPHISWLGTVGYLLLLDQIGSALRPLGSQWDPNKPSMLRALAYFSSTSELEAEGIYALRCALAHDYSLVNIRPNRPARTHHFVLHDYPGSVVVALPQTPWPGDFANRNPKNRTAINLEALGDLVERVCFRLVELAASNDLEIALKGGSTELIARYSMGLHVIEIAPPDVSGETLF